MVPAIFFEGERERYIESQPKAPGGWSIGRLLRACLLDALRLTKL